MGLCQSNELKNQKTISKAIDCQLNVTSKRIIQKMLLLGPGESGKSTCVKQIKILHANGYSESEFEKKKSIVFSNLVRNMLDIINGMNQIGIKFAQPLNSEQVSILEKHIEDGFEFSYISTSVKNAIKKLWSDENVQLAYEKHSEFHGQSTANYFFENVDRIAEKNYCPTNKDILLTRVSTTGVVKLHFIFNNIDFNVYDVGGQRSERRKWIHFFDDVNALIFVAAISEYDQVIRENNTTNRLRETLELFESISNSQYFTNSSLILFLNKIDLFAEKIKRVKLSNYFLSYKGASNYEEGVAFIKRRFIKCYTKQQKMYIHETCATDTNQLNNIFSSVLDTIIQQNLKDTGIL